MNLIDGSLAWRAAASVAAGSRIASWWHTCSAPCAVFDTSRALCVLRRRAWVLCVPVAVAVCASFAFPSAFTWPLLALLVTAAAAHAWPTLALALYPVAAIWTPKLVLSLVGDESVFVRIDHALILGAAVRHALTNHSVAPPALKPLFLFGTAALISTGAGLIHGTVASWQMAVPAIAQFVYLGLVFVCAASGAPRLKEWGIYAWALPLIAFAAYGIAEQTSPIARAVWNYRTFERGLFDGQANHAAGLLVVGALVGLALVRVPRWRVLGVCLAAASVAALPGAGSREALPALAAGLCCLGMVLRPLWMAVLLPALGLLFIMIPGTWWDAVTEPGGSLYDRFVHWKAALTAFSARPILGLGLGAAHRRFYDNQYVMILTETGILGTSLFLGWLAALSRSVYHASRGSGGAVALGALAGLVAMTVQGGAAVTFIVTLIAGPVLWLAGYAVGVAEDEGPLRENRTCGV
ncbi:MAG: O-antigen ligase family protein [bacterium]|nr:O-antigen ligase family protein [bacterium]